MSRWPKDSQAALLAFYGTPGPQVERQLRPLRLPFVLRYEGKPVKVRMHKKCAAAFESAFQKIWDYYGQDQLVLDDLGISDTAGTYNPRKVRGSATKWSNHAFGGAIDVDASHNGFNTGHGKMPLPVVAAMKSEGFRWGGDYRGRTDPMHFEACDNGQPDRTFEEWLDYYKQPQTYMAPVGLFEDRDHKEVMPYDERYDERADNRDDYPTRSLPSEVTPTLPKSLLKSKMTWLWTSFLTVFGLNNVNQVDMSLLSKLYSVATSPGFILLVLVACVGLTIYWRWRDHGRGQK